jgi:hypothetical protein
MLSFALPARVASSSPLLSAVARRGRWLGAGVALLLLAGGMGAEEAAGGAFGKDIQLAPFVVNGAPISVSIHARTKADRRYGEKFADEVVEIAYETLGDTTGKGLVIVGAEGEPHPIHFFRKFLALAQAGQLDPGVAASAGEVEGIIKKMQGILKVDSGEAVEMGITFETFVPALPMPLEGAALKLYQIAWAEKFDEARTEKKLQALTPADFARDELGHYDWALYLPTQSATSKVFKEVINKGMKAQKMGVFKRAAVRSAVFVFSPMLRKASEGLRKGMLFRTILDAESPYNDADLNELTKVYVGELMPDLKPGSGDEHGRALAAIEKQKIANAEYAKDPFVKPERLATFDAAAYAACEGEYTRQPPEVTHRFKREGDTFQWCIRDEKPRVFYPAGDRLLVSEDGTMTIRFLAGDDAAVTGVEVRWVRGRRTIPRKV